MFWAEVFYMTVQTLANGIKNIDTYFGQSQFGQLTSPYVKLLHTNFKKNTYFLINAAAHSYLDLKIRFSSDQFWHLREAFRMMHF
jgi:hypothetical protein